MSARAETSAGASPVAPVATRQASFSIPFKIDRAGNPATMPREVQLHVSTDRGVSWRLAERVRPEAGRFAYRSAGDGEYWFLVRTLDPQGKLRPEAPPTPELKVVVDTIIPALELEASRGEAGEVRAVWHAADVNLQRDSLKLSYQPIGSQDGWQPVAIDPMKTTNSGDVFRGETTWWPSSTSAPLVVRAEIADLAGNKTYTQAEVGPAALPAADPLVERLPPGEPIVEGSREEPIGAPLASRPDGATPPAMPTAFPVTVPSPTSVSTPSRVEAEVLPDGLSRPDPLTVSAEPALSAPTNVEPADIGSASAPVPLPQTVDAPLPTSQPVEPPPAKPTPVAAPVAMPVETPAETESTLSAADMLPAGVRPRMVNREHFELEYDISAIGSDGIGKIELWGTRDGGKHWRLFSTDDDLRSPAVATVDEEGLYGFRIVVETSSGLRSPEPQAGELPELWVGVDLSGPSARLLADETTSDAATGELTIRWEASDSILAARPVTLAYSNVRSGPWVTIAAGLENSGRYVWRPDHRVGEKIYLRLEVRDEAGNTTIVESEQPVTIERVRPQGRILNVRPISDATDK
ncbi:MAG TPA: Ig-like domain repeat protein [Pirellulales bacterium]|nr:Ig-like domain repeat protein [Pirellulales bacterium]